jgi:metal-sulfur cluster biosynthetic enzyme
MPKSAPKDKKIPTKEDVINVLKGILDPELMMDIWTLGLIYKIVIVKDIVKIEMTFTTPMCPYGPMLMDRIEDEIKSKIKSVKQVKLELVFDPPWQPPEDLQTMFGL